MARRLDHILVIDVESTCWEGKPPPGEESEIIEIGLCSLDLADMSITTPEAIFVAPERSSLSEFCIALTSIRPSMLADGLDFAGACGKLRTDYRSRERCWASWGDYDRRQFEHQCRDRSIGLPFGPTHLNVKHLFALAFGLAREVGMEEALARLDLPLEGRHHRGADDAFNIARILATLLTRLRIAL